MNTCAQEMINYYVFKGMIKPGESVRILRRALEGYTNQIC